MKNEIEYEIAQSVGQNNNARLFKIKNGGYMVKNEITGNEKYFKNEEYEKAMKYLDIKF